jgi:sulfonate transport system ATP-binding protein
MTEKEIKGEKISICHVKKEFQIEKESLMVLKDINLEIEAGDIVSIIGGSGCGKSTLLRLIAGLDYPNDGKILIDGKEVEKPSVDVGVLFQESRLLPWENTEKNIAFGLPEKYPREKKAELVKKYIKLVGLEGFEKALPGQLSGGMQKRVAIARTLINCPHILLLDEPFGALDAFTKMNLQEEVVRIWRKERMTTVLVTHDIDEAIFMGNKVIIMSAKPGVIKNVIHVELPSTRSRTSDDFEKIRLKVYREFFGEDKVADDYSI